MLASNGRVRHAGPVLDSSQSVSAHILVPLVNRDAFFVFVENYYFHELVLVSLKWQGPVERMLSVRKRVCVCARAQTRALLDGRQALHLPAVSETF